jgi:hypothetical protein
MAPSCKLRTASKANLAGADREPVDLPRIHPDTAAKYLGNVIVAVPERGAHRLVRPFQLAVDATDGGGQIEVVQPAAQSPSPPPRAGIAKGKE